MVYPHKWSPISYRSSVGQGKFAGQRPAFYHCAMQPTTLMSDIGTKSKKLFRCFGMSFFKDVPDIPFDHLEQGQKTGSGWQSDIVAQQHGYASFLIPKTSTKFRRGYTSNLVGMWIIASASPRMTNYP